MVVIDTPDVTVEASGDQGATGEPTWRRWLVPVGGLVLLAVAALLVFQLLPRTPGNDSVEAGFLRDMSMHHAQAVEMALIIRDRAEDEQLRFLATDIMLSQQGEIGMMDGWLRLWDLPLASSEAPMSWMDHPVDGPMPGMATHEHIEQLRTLPADEAEVLFLQLMIRHHQGGVEMAKAYLERGDQKAVTAFAQNVVRVQDSEIGTMNGMLEARGTDPITDSLPESHEGH